MKVAVIMGSISDWNVMKEACLCLDTFKVAYEQNIVSAHRTPLDMVEFAKTAKAQGFDIIIAGAGGAAHLPGMVASLTTLPVIGVPIKGSKLEGLDSLLSIVQMPPGVPVATMAIDGAKNAALFAVRVLSLNNQNLALKLEEYIKGQKDKVERSKEDLVL